MKDFSEEHLGEPALLIMETCPSESNLALPSTHKGVIASSYLNIPDQDDRYPGSFFRIPGPPIPGRTTWSIN
jgi:hypothetical protein